LPVPARLLSRSLPSPAGPRILLSVHPSKPALLAVTAIVAATAALAADSSVLRWRELPTLPDVEGFAGSFAGQSNGALIVAGGANFPDRRPWEGGTKTWYDRVFVLARDSNAWIQPARLPAANGYGVALTLPEGVALIGGGDAKRNFDEVWLARWDGTTVRFTAWPKLPRPLAMAAGAQVGRTVYVSGGLDRPDATTASRSFYALDLDRVASGWRELPACPGPERFLATAGAHDGSFYLFSGARLVSGADGKPAREWLRDAWRFTPGKGWQRVADLPRVAVAAPSPAPWIGGKLLVIGGDDGAQVAVAPTAHRGFPRDVLAYDPARDTWSRSGEVPFSLVTTSIAPWGAGYVIPGGEARPGVRSPKIWAAE
jgi:N-acetylneuraminic acid mutarotase